MNSYKKNWSNCQRVNRSKVSLTFPAARSGSRALQGLSSEQRASVLHHLASLLVEREEEILAANQRDLDSASDLSGPLRARLSLSPQRLASLADGLRQLAGQLLFIQLSIKIRIPCAIKLSQLLM